MALYAIGERAPTIHPAAFVHPENTVPTPKIQGPNVGAISLDGITPFFQIPNGLIPNFT